MKPVASIRCGVGVLLACALSAFPSLADERGEYLASIMDCGGCHTPGNLMGKPDMERYLGGSEVGFQIPELGVFYPPNLTPDATGLAGWSEEDIVTAVRTGVRPDGRQLAPIMPWMNYAALTDDDAMALARYIKGLPAVSNKVPGPVGASETPPLAYMTIVMP